MTTVFPTSLDVFVNPKGSSSGGTDNLNTPTVIHGTQHQNINDAMAAVEIKLGADSSAVATSIDYLLKNAASSDPGHKHTTSSITTSFTAGSVIFSSGSVLAQDNANIFWDNTNKRLGIGKNSSLTAKITALCDAAGVQGIIVTAAASQSANMQEWQNNAGTAKIAIGTQLAADCMLHFPSVAGGDVSGFDFLRQGSWGSRIFISDVNGDFHYQDTSSGSSVDRFTIARATGALGISGTSLSLGAVANAAFNIITNSYNGTAVLDALIFKTFDNGSTTPARLTITAGGTTSPGTANVRLDNSVLVVSGTHEIAKVCATFIAAASQSGNIIEIQNSSLVVLHQITPKGFILNTAASVSNRDTEQQFLMLNGVGGTERVVLVHDTGATRFRITSPDGTKSLKIEIANSGTTFTNSFGYNFTYSAGNNGFVSSGTTFECLTDGNSWFVRLGNDTVRMKILAMATQSTDLTQWQKSDSTVYTSIGSTGLINKYNSVATTGWGIPAIYGTGRSTAQTAAVASVAAYTVGASDGSFIVSANVLVTTSTLHSFTVTCAYTDEGNTARTLTLQFSNLAGTFLTGIANAAGAVPYEGCPLQIRCKASTAITIATTGTFTTVTYNVEANITQIS